MDADILLKRDERDEILKAVSAIERQLKDVNQEPHWKSLYVIQTNLTIIRARVTKHPRVTPN